MSPHGVIPDAYAGCAAFAEHGACICSTGIPGTCTASRESTPPCPHCGFDFAGNGLPHCPMCKGLKRILGETHTDQAVSE